MAQQLKTDIILNLAGNLAAKARQYGTSMSDFAKKNDTAMTMIKRSTEVAGRGIDTLGNRYVGIAAAFATGATVRSIGNFSEQMTRLGTNAKLTDDQVATLKGNILELANQKDIRIDTTQFTAAVDELLGKTGDFEFVNNNLENMGLFMQAFGADAKSSGALFAQFREKGIKDAKDVMNVIDDLYSQFAVGSVNVKDLASISEQLFSVYQGKGPAAITQMASLVQLFAKTKGNANESLTSIQGVFAAFSDKTKVAFLDKQGIAVFKKGTKELREPVELLLEILDKAKNDPLKLGDVFDQTSLQGLASLYSKDNKDLLMQMNTSTGEYGETQKAAAKNAAEFNNAVKSLNTSFSQFAESRLSKPIQDLADAINEVDDKTIDNWLKWGETALWVVGGLVAAKKGLDLAGSIKNVFGSSKGSAGGKGGMTDMGVMPVYVVNMGAGGMGGGITDVMGGKNTPANPTKTSRFFNRQTIATLGAVGYGLSVADEFSPVNIRRAASVDPALSPGIPVLPGLLDAIDDFKKWFSGAQNGDAASIVNNMNAVGSKLDLKIAVSDDRIKVTPVYVPKGITIDSDTGIN
ncbi:MAG: phage tail tape measure protein [Gammaproteobacteria bacterium]|uniref:Putative tail tape measure protein n=1 Tax=viral metagenome TaxID=1070528 RepID=A0A6M3XNR2_9ZZZZ|nr:phage tail tape measure protein [Gammaproteobacteria bacterium]MBU1477434.1 phage tail tape measure protein [Gammaproteobacteria bacterium]MBU2002597.1 phage tail tape measure protein [Gammaproteobacteria bacterium]MBU2131772.1 phage tail tape measure protein [Gammaproteobacteria bacterium]MBU2186507.1 phage tail tape measure protein [Gammaproteobacteria bacterium]